MLCFQVLFTALKRSLLWAQPPPAQQTGSGVRLPLTCTGAHFGVEAVLERGAG